MGTASAYLPAPIVDRLLSQRRRWLVTGAAGFIGSNLVEALLDAGQSVIGLDNFSTGHRQNVDAATSGAVISGGQFHLIEGDIRDRDTCASAVRDIDIVLHQAALGSVPRSIAEPVASHDSNVTGFINMLDAARLAGVERFVYAASSSTYGDHEALPKVEDRTGNPLSPYAATKLVNEIYAAVYARTYGFRATGLRYFNVFGPRQDPDGAYAAVIPRWVAAMVRGEAITINGDGDTSRDFCFIANAVQANILAAFAPDEAQGEVYNVACGERTSLNDLHEMIRAGLGDHGVTVTAEPLHADFRAGDVRHSLADIGKAKRGLDYRPTHDVRGGIGVTLPYYLSLAGR